MFPRKAPKSERPQRGGAIFYARRADGMVLVRTRPPRGLLGGMCELPGGEWSVGFDEARAESDAPLKAKWTRVPGHASHVFTHFALNLTVFVGVAPTSVEAPEGARWIAEDHLGDEALPSVMRKAVAHAQDFLRKRER
jgi:A/G-specific adenine glycosylase